MMIDDITCLIVCIQFKFAVTSSYTLKIVLFNDNNIFKIIDFKLTNIWFEVISSLMFSKSKDEFEKKI